ncbi:hypothetical protein [Microbaculum sp. FT89]|uniref:hypothetical protein n=1 Tax=Microbaculum sp. FT89 TaxID=3447298 RepID=UPI003F533FAA
MSKNHAYIVFNGAAVVVAYLMLALSVWLAPVDLSTKGYWGMGVLLLTAALVNFVKFRTDDMVAEQLASKIEKARNEKLINEYVGKEA